MLQATNILLLRLNLLTDLFLGFDDTFLLRRLRSIDWYHKLAITCFKKMCCISQMIVRGTLTNLTFRGPCIVIYSHNKTNEMQ
jgi:hypothetical protein